MRMRLLVIHCKFCKNFKIYNGNDQKYTQIYQTYIQNNNYKIILNSLLEKYIL